MPPSANIVETEYQMLREEILRIQDRIARWNALCLTAAGGLFAVGVTISAVEARPLILLLPFLFLIPSARFIASESQCITALAAFLRLQLQEVLPFNWESALFSIRQSGNEERWQRYAKSIRQLYMLIGVGIWGSAMILGYVGDVQQVLSFVGVTNRALLSQKWLGVGLIAALGLPLNLALGYALNGFVRATRWQSFKDYYDRFNKAREDLLGPPPVKRELEACKRQLEDERISRQAEIEKLKAEHQKELTSKLAEANTKIADLQKEFSSYKNATITLFCYDGENYDKAKGNNGMWKASGKMKVGEVIGVPGFTKWISDKNIPANSMVSSAQVIVELAR